MIEIIFYILVGAVIAIFWGPFFSEEKGRDIQAWGLMIMGFALFWPILIFVWLMKFINDPKKFLK